MAPGRDFKVRTGAMPQTVLSHSLFRVALEPVEIQHSSALPCRCFSVSATTPVLVAVVRSLSVVTVTGEITTVRVRVLWRPAGKACAKRAAATVRPPQGRHHNAARQQRFRDRQKEKVTHQGSLSLRAPVLLLPARNAGERGPDREGNATRSGIFCHFCHCPCDSYPRNRFLHASERAPPGLTR